MPRRGICFREKETPRRAGGGHPEKDPYVTGWWVCALILHKAEYGVVLDGVAVDSVFRLGGVAEHGCWQNLGPAAYLDLPGFVM